MLIRKTIIAFLLIAIFTGIGLMFWFNELVYSLPTPIPAHYVNVTTGKKIDIPELSALQGNKATFLHFFNPDCPCSKFNINHFKSLVTSYRKQVNFAIIVMNNKNYSAEQIQKKFGLDLPVFFDTSIAIACGVYSTPQAVIMKNDHTLFYRGNYNRSRYCTDEKTNYAQQALDSLLHNHTIIFNEFALRAYGCSLPNCLK